MRYKFSFIILIMSYAWISCGDQQGKQTLSPEVKYMADTMFAKRRAKLIEKLDSTCTAEFEVLKQRSIDSLFAIEKKRIKELSE